MSSAAESKNRVGSPTEELSYIDCVGPLHVDCVDRVVRDGLPIPGTEEVADSWRRCLTANHLDPDNRVPPQIITQDEIRVASEPSTILFSMPRKKLIVFIRLSGPKNMSSCYATGRVWRSTTAGMSPGRKLSNTGESGWVVSGPRKLKGPTGSEPALLSSGPRWYIEGNIFGRGTPS